MIGGVMSGIGKGIVAASIGSILKSHGLKVNNIKLDPYLNVDAGTMNPFEHGETFVTGDGLEADLDLGHYERLTSNKTNKNSIVTSGKLYQTVITKERKGDYLGTTVQVIPHVTDLIKEFIMRNSSSYDFIIVEIGGTVGDIECKPFLEAIRQLSLENSLTNELKDFFQNFDAIFLSIFPTFIEEFNKMLIENERIYPKEKDILTPELRIYALIRLGINDSARIAELLHYSPQTVYNYKIKIKNKLAISKEEFSEKILVIGR